MAELSKVLRDSPDGTALWSGIVNAVQTSVSPRAQGAALRDPNFYCGSDIGIVNAVSLRFRPKGGPFGRGQVFGLPKGKNNRMVTWDWAAPGNRGNAGNAKRTHADCLESIADIPSRTLTFKGNCRFPPYSTGEMAQE